MRRSTTALTKASSNQRFVRLTTSGATFTPIVELASGSAAVVKWTVEETGEVTTGVNPNINFGSAATRHVRLSATGGRGLADVITFNMGFNTIDDAGRFNIGATYNRAPDTGITTIENINYCSRLLRFCAANGNLACHLDFTGCSELEFIECAYSWVGGAILTGCTSLIRLCLEQTNVTHLDLNPVAGNLYDLRSAAQHGGTLTLAVLTSPLAQLYHFCARDQHLINHPTPEQLPVVEERWDWNTDQTGTLTVASSALRSLMSQGNDYTAADLTNMFPPTRGGLLWINFNQIASINLTGCSGLGNIDLSYNSLNQSAIDGVLAEVNSWGTSNHYLDLRHNAAPSAAGEANASSLSDRGWTVYTDTPAPELNITRNSTAVADAGTDSVSGSDVGVTADLTYVLANNGTSALGVTVPVTISGANNCTAIVTTPPSTSIAAGATSNLVISATPTAGGAWSFAVSIDNTDANENPYNWTVSGTTVSAGGVDYDDFERPDVTGIANVGNGWYAWGGATANIVSGDLVRTDGASYRQVLNPAATTLPADYSVTMIVPNATLGTFWGLTGRWNGTTGVRILFAEGSTALTIGDASMWNANNVTVTTDAGYPASWYQNQDHTITMKMTGTLIEVFLDNQPTRGFHATVTTNSTATGTAYGICGEGQSRHWHSIGVTIP